MCVRHRGHCLFIILHYTYLNTIYRVATSRKWHKHVLTKFSPRKINQFVCYCSTEQKKPFNVIVRHQQKYFHHIIIISTRLTTAISVSTLIERTYTNTDILWLRKELLISYREVSSVRILYILHYDTVNKFFFVYLWSFFVCTLLVQL